MTLIELLVVIAIIVLLASLAVGVFVRARDKGQELTVRADLTALDTAIGNFRTAYNQTPIPCAGGGTQGTFRLCSDYPTPATDTWPEVQFLMRMFPRMSRTDNGLRDVDYSTDPFTITTNTVSSNNPILLDGNQCMVFFLTGGSFTDYTGFATDPSQPFKSTGSRKNAFFELPKSKRMSPQKWFSEKKGDFTWLANNSSNTRWNGDSTDGNQEPWMIDPWGNPYLYFTSNAGNDYPFQNDYTHSDATIQATLRQPLRIGPWGGEYSPFENGNGVGSGKLYADAPAGTLGPSPFRESNTKLTNRQTFQIISAGPDGQIGPGSPLKNAGPPATYEVFKPGGTNYTQVDAGGDDFTNIRPLKLGVSD
jgi:type II secretory pathway pseudopilin PulG